MKITLEFDDKNSADEFIAWWLDGGGEQESDFYTVLWDRDFIKLKRNPYED